jgi:hypothetical protein
MSPYLTEGDEFKAIPSHCSFSLTTTLVEWVGESLGVGSSITHTFWLTIRPDRGTGKKANASHLRKEGQRTEGGSQASLTPDYLLSISYYLGFCQKKVYFFLSLQFIQQ